MISSLTSTDLNYLVFRYLHESGFTHSAFTLGYEAGISKGNIDGNLVPPGALVTFVQKGIQYLELEANLTNDDLDVEEDFHFLQPLDLMTKDVNELHKIIKEKKENLRREKKKAKITEVAEQDGDLHKHELLKEKEKENEPSGKEHEIEKMDKDEDIERSKGKEKPQEDLVQTMHISNEVEVKHKEEGIEGPEPMEICANSESLTPEIPDSDVLVLEGHTSEVFACAWNPAGSLLASGSADSTARIWAIGDAAGGTKMHDGTPGVLLLKHFKGQTNENKDVTTLDWNGDGTLLATGSYDGQARIWTKDGELDSSFNKHKGPIFSLKWNKKGDYLLSGSVDKTAVVWDVKTGTWRQQFEFHTAPTLDVDWKNNVTFASCSTDTMIHVCKVGETQPLKTFAGHRAEVNAIKWDPSGSLLASCSDDGTAKIWSMKQDTCLYDFKDHTKEIYTIRWSPTGPSTDNPNHNLLLASASFDSTIKLWDVEVGRLIHSLNEHREPVYSIAFSPNGEYLASGSLDRSVNIWSLKEMKIVKTYKGNGGIFEVCWHKEGNRLAACFANNVVCVLDTRL